MWSRVASRALQPDVFLAHASSGRATGTELGRTSISGMQSYKACARQRRTYEQLNL